MKSIYIKGLSKNKEKTLLSRGVPAQDMIPSRMNEDVEASLVKISPNIPRIVTHDISVNRQYKALLAVMEKPLRGSYTIGISSFPTDQRAKHLAITIMNAAIDAHLKAKRADKAMPLWHRVYGGLNDPLRDRPVAEIPCMLVISNINDGSSQIKLEKVRDLLEKFSDIPRIVVSGGEPPCDLFANKLHYPMKMGFYLGPPNRLKEL